MSDSPLPPLHTLTFTPYGTPKAIAFKTLGEVDAWVRAEQKTWQPFHALDRSLNYEHRDCLERVIRALNHATGNETPETMAALVEALRRLEHLPYLAAANPGVAHLLEAIEQQDSDTAEAIFKFLTGKAFRTRPGQQYGPDLARLLRAAVQCGDQGPEKRAATLKKDISDRLGKWEGQFAALAKTAGGFVSRAEQALTAAVTRQEDASAAIETLRDQSAQQLRDLAEAHEKELSSLHAEQLEQLAGLHRNWDAALAHIEKTYTEHMRLKAPADFWQQKANSHKKLALCWLIALLSLLGIGLVGVAGSYVLYLYDWIEHLSKPNAGVVSAVLVGLPVLLYLSLVKVAHKSYRDQARFSADAAQRTTLVQTYLALTNENGEGVQGSERLLALHALFRGSAQADGPDDTPPINTLEALVQGLKPKAP